MKNTGLGLLGLMGPPGLVGLLGLIGLLPASSLAQSPPPEPAQFGMSLEQLAEIKVESASLVATSLARAPAIISVIAREEMEAWGDRSVADALARVPGLYRVDTQGFQDVGVRGLFGGQRSWNRQFKLLIDGQPQAFRPDASNFLSPGLLPMSSVDRIEVVRGPSSALYGADAFLATVNVITRKDHVGASEASAKLRAYAGSANGVDASISGGNGRLGLLFAVQAEHYELNGLQLPDSSPLLGALPALRGVESSDARLQPISLLGRASFETEALKHQLELNYSRIDSVAEFLDFGVLSHKNRYAQYRAQLGWQSQWDIGPSWQAKFRWNVARSGPASTERLETGTSSYPKREFSSTANDLGLNFNWALNPEHGLSFGADRTVDNQDSMQVLLVAPNGSRSLSGKASTAMHLSNTGVFAQYLWQTTDKLGLSANWRLDDHNQFGRNTNWRAAAVYEHSRELNAKLIWSTSYKAPSVFDLLAQPLYGGDVIGNLKLRAETASNTELQVNWRPSPRLQLTANVYQLEVKDKIELQQTGLNYQPVNRGRFSGQGAELDGSYEEGAHRFGIAWTGLNMSERDPVPLVGDLVRPPERFPEQSVRAEWRWHSGKFGQWATELLYASKRHASFSNAFANFLTPYSLAPSTRLNLVWTQVFFSSHELQLRLDNLLNANYSEPGYGSVDFPGKGRSALLSYRYRWN
ncbi:TonB-dependent receptor [Paucibacter sp. B2R-40]|uniref:TonB-dependent receptor plug domain-containing protein n=1 Tax=Paucibacter sp. B2R-40 TaxID=2893554 RepID=UPI0021E3EA37|nr:TonB-dependent receptor [Paucibacter sp. B2R-40]MCV2354424.1 TonB-dependent receptor [Paucibacter sp. B2R-40]